MAHIQTYSNLHLAVLDADWNARTCNYWYTVTAASTSHTAFRQRSCLLNWLADMGLSVDAEIPEPGKVEHFRINGSYRRALHMDPLEFYSLAPLVTRRGLGNGDYTLELVTLDPDGMRTAHQLNCNIKEHRQTFDYRESNALYC